MFSPDCKDKHVCMDQGGELCENPEAHGSFAEFHHDTRPAEAEASSPQDPRHGRCSAGSVGQRHGSTEKLSPSTTSALKTDNLFPGSCMSVDHFTCDPKGRLLSAFGKERIKDKRKG